jgi:hypothetical protein
MHSCTVLSMKLNDGNSEWLGLNIERREHRKHCVGQI